MATNKNFTNFRAVYDELTDEVTRSRPQFLPDHLDNWFAFIDETPRVSELVRQIGRGVGIQQYEFLKRLKPANCLTLPYQMPDRQPPTAKPQWPTDREKRLGTQLAVFREIARRTLTIVDFGMKFIEGASPEEAPTLAIEHVFSPMARELRRRLEASLLEAEEEADIPASDRTGHGGP
jgi:hypothetical protein